MYVLSFCRLPFAVSLLGALVMCQLRIAYADVGQQSKKVAKTAEARFSKRTETIAAEYVRLIDAQITAAQAAGEFDLLKELNGGRREFQASRTLPDSDRIPTLPYRQAMTHALDQCLASYDRVIRQATTKREFAIANELTAARDEFVKKFENSFPATLIQRVRWEHPNGHFEKADGDVWYEHVPGFRHSFREIERNAANVILLDKSRECTVVLSETTCFVQFGQGKTKPFYRGEWRD